MNAGSSIQIRVNALDKAISIDMDPESPRLVAKGAGEIGTGKRDQVECCHSL